MSIESHFADAVTEALRVLKKQADRRNRDIWTMIYILSLLMGIVLYGAWFK